MSSFGPTWKIGFKVARWLMLAALLLVFLPRLLLLIAGIVIVAPKGRVWGTYWGSRSG